MRRFAEIVILVFCLTQTKGQRNQSVEARLLNNLLAGTRQDVRPVLNVSKPTVVTVEMLYAQIVTLDSKNQILTSQVWMRLYWKTPFLVWDPREYEGLDTLSLKPSTMWLPDITVYNVVSDKQEKSLYNVLDSNIIVTHDGQIKWLAPAVLKTDCKIAIDFFPFDSQACPVKIGSWIHDTRQIDLRFKNDNNTNEVTKSYRKNSEWVLMSIHKERNLEQFSCCPAPFSMLAYTVKVRRRASYYVVNLILPCGIIAISCLISFCLPPDSGERVSLVITILLAMSFYMTIIADKMPPNSEVIPMISVFFMIVMVQIAFVLIVTCLIIRFHFNTGPVPAHVGCLINGKLAKLVGLKKRTSNKVKSSPKQPINQTHIPEHNEDHLHLEKIQDLQVRGTRNNEALAQPNDYRKPEKQDSLEDSRSKEEEEVDGQNTNTWPFAARVINRAFFVVFLCSSLLSSVIIFISIPRFSPKR